MAGVWLSDPGMPASGGWRISRRAGLVEKAATDWKNALVDLGGRNNLLHYRDLKRGTLDLTAADPEAVSGLLLGKTIRVSALFTDPGSASRCCGGSATIHNKAKENFEERGLETLFDRVRPGDVGEQAGGVGAVRAGAASAGHACARSGAAQDEFELAVTGETGGQPDAAACAAGRFRLRGRPGGAGRRGSRTA